MRDRFNYYATLELDSMASELEIKKAFRKKMLKFHPDKYEGSEETAAIKTRELVAAYQVLSNPRKKQIYDLGGNVEEAVTPDTHPSFEDKQTTPNSLDVPLLAHQGRKTKRDRALPADPNFNYDNFRRVLFTMTYYHANEDIEALQDFVEENINNLQALFKSGEQVKEVIEYLNHDATYQLITQFDAEWLKSLEFFSHLPHFAGFLNVVPVHHWKMIIDHLGNNWFKENLNSYIFLQMINALSSYDKTQRNAHPDHVVKKYNALFDYLGREWLIAWPRLGKLLNFNNDEKFRTALLTFLDGEEHWLSQKIKKMEHIGKILDDIAEKKSCDFQMPLSKKPVSMFASHRPRFPEVWESFLNYLDPNWRQTIANNPLHLNIILNQLDDLEIQPEKIEWFLKAYLDKTKLMTFENIMNVLKPVDEEAVSLNRAKSLQFIQVFDSAEIYFIILKNTTFDAALQKVDPYKEEPFYSALLFALTKAFVHKRKFNKEQTTSLRETIWSYTPLGNDFAAKIAAAEDLMDCMVNNTELESVSVVNEVDELRRINTRYVNSRHVKALPEPTVLLLKAEPAPQLLLEDKDDGFVCVDQVKEAMRLAR